MSLLIHDPSSVWVHVRVVAWRSKKSQLFPRYNFSPQTISGLFVCLYYRLPKSASASKNLTPLTQIHLYSQYNHLDFLLYLHSVYGGGASLKACTVAYRPFLLVYWTESVESYCGVTVCDTHLGFNQAEDILPQFIQEIELTKGTIRIYARGMYWLSPKDI